MFFWFALFCAIALLVHSFQMVYFVQFLNFLQARVRELNNNDSSSYTATILLLGIPNVGKSALANSLHRIGRISAAGTTLNHIWSNFFYSSDLDYVGKILLYSVL